MLPELSVRTAQWVQGSEPPLNVGACPQTPWLRCGLQEGAQSLLRSLQGLWSPGTGPGWVVSPLLPFSKPQPLGRGTLGSMALGPEGGSQGELWGNCGSVSGQPHVLVWEVTLGQMPLWASEGRAQLRLWCPPVLISPRVWGLFCSQGACRRGGCWPMRPSSFLSLLLNM